MLVAQAAGPHVTVSASRLAVSGTATISRGMTRMLCICAAAASVALAGCATRPPTTTGFLGDYATLLPVGDTVRAQILQRADAAALPGVTAVVILPTRISDLAEIDRNIPASTLPLVTGEIDRQLCFELSDRFEIAPAPGPGVAQVEVVVTRIQQTGAVSSVASAAISRAVPGPGSVRLPVGQGGLSVEARAVAATGAELGGMSWSRGAGVAMDRGSLSPVGDAHRFASAFAGDFAELIGQDRRVTRADGAPDPCARFGPRLDLARRAAGIGLGLHLPGEAVPASPIPADPPSTAPEAAPAPPATPAVPDGQ